MSLQQGLLIPSASSSGEVVAQLSSFDHAELVRVLAGQGFGLIELSGDLTLFFPQAFAPPAIDRLAVLKEELGLSYTVHLPLWSVEPSTPLPSVRRGSVEILIEVIRATRLLQPEVYVLHATGALAAEFYQMDLPAVAHAFLLRVFQAQAGESIQRILAETAIPSRQLAIETIEFPLDLTLELAEQFDLAICLDVGHILAGFSGPADLFDVLERCLPRLAEVHLHDCPLRASGQAPLYGQDHRSLGEGDLDLERFLDRLEEAGFDGPVILELTVEEARSSFETIRAVRPELLQ
jgi:sugar phosphate isomerase/epimerase